MAMELELQARSFVATETEQPEGDAGIVDIEAEPGNVSENPATQGKHRCISQLFWMSLMELALPLELRHGRDEVGLEEVAELRRGAPAPPRAPASSSGSGPSAGAPPFPPDADDNSGAAKFRERDRLLLSLARSEGFVAVKTCAEMERAYMDYLSELLGSGKDVVSCGPLRRGAPLRAPPWPCRWSSAAFDAAISDAPTSPPVRVASMAAPAAPRHCGV
ncbi:hypothetical protein EJB05_53465, partial [Eragrostis curvula]